MSFIKCTAIPKITLISNNNVNQNVSARFDNLHNLMATLNIAIQLRCNCLIEIIVTELITVATEQGFILIKRANCEQKYCNIEQFIILIRNVLSSNVKFLSWPYVEKQKKIIYVRY